MLAIYMFLAGFAGYVVFMRRTLKHLDPGAVIPERVKAALDILTEGVVLIDSQQQVVLANTAISGKLGLDSSELLGVDLSILGWSVPHSEDTETAEYPWQTAMEGGDSQIGTRLRKQIQEDVTKYIAQLPNPVTASFGVSSTVGGADDTGKLVDQADQALYASKEYGRNCLTRWDQI